jgi:hypothetical protein
VLDGSLLAVAIGLKIAAFASIIVGLLGERPPVLRWSRRSTVVLLVALWTTVAASTYLHLTWALPSFLSAAALWLLVFIPPCKDWGVDPYTLIYPAEA